MVLKPKIAPSGSPTLTMCVCPPSTKPPPRTPGKICVAVPRSSTRLRLCATFSVLRHASRPVDTLTVVTDSSTPLFCTEPMLRSWLEKPDVAGSGTLSSRSLVTEW